MSGFRLVLLFLRRARHEVGPSLALAGLVLITAFLFALGPRLLTATADDALRTTVTGYAVSDRSVELVEQTRICACDQADPLADAEAEGDRLQAMLPGHLRSTIADRVMAIDSTRWSVVEPQHVPAVLTIRWEPRALDHITFVAGRAPAGTTKTATIPSAGQLPAFTTPVMEAALVDESAEGLGVGVGDTLLLRPDPRDPLPRAAPVGTAVEIVGIYRISNPDDPFWFDEAALVHPTQRVYSSNVQFLDLFALAAPAAYAPYYTTSATSVGRSFNQAPLEGLPIHYRWRLFVDPARLRASDVGQLQLDLRRLQSTLPASGLSDGGAVIFSLLPTILQREDAAWQSALAVVAVVATGPAVIAGAAFGLVALLAARRRRATAWFWRVRGASWLQLAIATAAEAVLLVAPAAVIAVVLVGMVALGSASEPMPAASVVAVAAVAGVAFGLIGGTVVRLPPPDAPPAGARGGRVDRRRLVLEAGLLGVAVAAVALLRERTVNAAGGGGTVGIDPLLVAAPALAGIAAGTVARRILPLPLSLAARAAGSGRGLPVALGLRRATRLGGGGALLLVLLATVIVGTFSALALGQLDRAADVIAWHDVGAPVRIRANGGVLPPVIADAATKAGADAVAPAYRTVVNAGAAGPRTDLLAIDAPAYARLGSGLPLDADLPPELVTPARKLAPGDPVPVVISTALASGPNGLHVGSAPNVTIDGRQTALRVVAVRDTFPTLDPGGAFMIGSMPELNASRSLLLQATDLFVRAPDAATPALRALAASQASPMTITTRSEVAATVRDSPIVRAVEAWVEVAAIAGAAYAALAVLAALTLAAGARTAETGILRTFGLTRRQAVTLVVAEHGPIVGLAVVLGVAIGTILFVALRPGLGLTGVVGSPLEIPIAVEAPALALLLAYVVALAAVGIAIGAAIERRPAIAAIIRRGIG
ncbi:MAG TPA: FtsX-like permease family protein [Candidatus Limnocylindrales bacterium]